MAPERHARATAEDDVVLSCGYGVVMISLWCTRVPSVSCDPKSSSTGPSRGVRTGVSGLVLMAVLSVTACSPTSQNSPAATSSAGVSTEPVREPTTASSESAIGAEVAWVLGVLNAGGPVAEADLTEHLAPVMLEQLSADEFTGVFEQLRANQPWTATSVQEDGDQAVVRLTGKSDPELDMSVSLDPAGQINGLFFTPASDRVASTSWEEVEQAVNELPARTTISVSRVTDSPQEILMAGDGAAMPIGSIFKLYVLGAVVQAVEDGVLEWETPLTLTEDLRSLPSGKLQDEPAGTVVTVREAAEGMISISDNTATDMLMDAVGREAVENAQTALGHHDPTLNTPFLTTRELFQLGWGKQREAATNWAATDVDGRVQILGQLPKGTLDIAPAAVTEPVWQLGIDWFATGADLQAAHLGLQKLAETEAGEPVREILAINPGLGMSFGDVWTYVGFKGGSSVGELAGSWYVERSDGERFTLSIQATSQDPADVADVQTYYGQIEDALSLLADS